MHGPPAPKALEAASPPRTTRLPLPPYRHLPGSTPHPRLDPARHARGAVSPGEEPFLYGVDLYNRGYWWEAHEAWEEAWIREGRRGPAADLLRGLVQAAAALLKVRAGNAHGARRLSGRALTLLEATGAREAGREMGVDAGAFAAELKYYFRCLLAGAAPPPTVRDFPFLRLEDGPDHP